MNLSPEKSGLLIAVGLIMLFFLMKVLGLLHIVELRVLNTVIVLFGIIAAIKTSKRNKPEKFTYFQGMVTGVYAGVIGCAVFGFFVFLYVSFIDTAMMQGIIDNEPMGRFMNPYIVSLIIAVEGVASTMLFSFIIMNYMDPLRLE